MAFFSHLFTDSVDLEPLSGVASDGSASFGAKTTGIDARVERNIEMGVDQDGIAADTATVVWLGQEVGKGDRLHLPGGEVMEVKATESDDSIDGATTLYKAMG